MRVKGGRGDWGGGREGKMEWYIPAMGGKRMAMRPRKMSLVHILFSLFFWMSGWWVGR